MKRSDLDAEIDRLRRGIGELVMATEPVVVDVTAVRRFEEVFRLDNGAAHDGPIPWTWLPLIAKQRPSVLVDQRPPAPLDVRLGSPVNGGTRIVPVEPAYVGDALAMTESVFDVLTKDGSTGPLVIVTTERSILKEERICARYYATLVYRVGELTPT